MKALVAGIVLLCAQPALAQAAFSPPRTSDGRPDLQGYWLSGFITPVERPDKLSTLVIPADQQAAALAMMTAMNDEGEVYDPEKDYNPLPAVLLELDGEMRSSQIVEPADGKLPLTSLAKAALDQFSFNFDDPEGRPSSERCMDGLVNAPIAGLPLLIPLQLVQTADAIVLAMEDMEPVRIVSFAAPHSSRTRSGHSLGRWEGDTLIVETSQFAITDRAGLTFRGAGVPVTSDSRVIERFRLTSPDTILYQFTVEDPSLYSAPWRAEFLLRRTTHAVYEYACHEGNRSMIHILTAARLGRQTKKERDEQKLAAEKQTAAAPE
ncbi:MAG: hypothetical protein EON93_11080 [Burkholderiales bacterium]|nr:MAG: hypothetical protein EON93_11080 [Burkholderiales bacterium]